MSLYNMLFGMNPLALVLLSALDLAPGDCGRFRDAWVVKPEVAGGCYRIAVYTRNGGDNRAYHMPDFSDHPNYLFDRDDAFDATYATIYFSIPEKWQKHLIPLATDDKSVSEKFQELTEDMNKGKQTSQVQRALDVGRMIMEDIAKAMADLRDPEDGK